MKTRSILVLILLVSTINTFAQSPNESKKIGIINNEGEPILNKNGIAKIKKNSNTKVLIDGFNVNLYTVTVNKNIYTYNYTENNGVKALSKKTDNKKYSLDEFAYKISKDSSLSINNTTTIGTLLAHNFAFLKKRYHSALYIPSKKQFQKEITECDNQLDAAKKQFSKLNEYLAKADTVQTKQLLAQQDSLYNLISYTNSISTDVNDVFIVEHPIIFDSGDEVDIEVSIVNKKTKATVYQTKHKAYVYGDIKINFHAGLAFEFNNSNKSYSFLADTENTVKVIEDDLPLDLTPSIAIFTNAYYKSQHGYDFGLSLGVGGNTNDGLSYYTGLSCLIGRNDRIVLTTGPSFAQRDCLKSIYKVEQTFDKSNSPDSKDLIEKKWNSGWFISIGYNLNSLSKNK